MRPCRKRPNSWAKQRITIMKGASPGRRNCIDSQVASITQCNDSLLSMNTQLIPYTIKTALRIFATLVFGLGLNAFATTGVDVVVPGSANPYLAGMPDGSTASGDTAPTQSPTQVLGLNLSGSAVLTFNATGSVSYGGGSPTDPPDGTQPGSHGPENGLSGFSANWNCLVGVFLDDNQPDGTDAPDPLAFSPDDVAISPGLKQVFFIGDGLTSSGTAQQVNVPAGATPVPWDHRWIWLV